jgi:hypothetical protein
MTRKDGSLPRWCYEIVFKNAKKKRSNRYARTAMEGSANRLLLHAMRLRCTSCLPAFIIDTGQSAAGAPHACTRAGRLRKKGQPKLPHKTAAETRHGGEQKCVKARIVCGREAVAEPNPCVKHRPSLMGNDIAADRISCKPQKLQAMSATVKVRHDRWRKVRHAGRTAWLPRHGPIVERPSIGRRHGYWQGVG